MVARWSDRDRSAAAHRCNFRLVDLPARTLHAALSSSRLARAGRESRAASIAAAPSAAARLRNLKPTWPFDRNPSQQTPQQSKIAESSAPGKVRCHSERSRGISQYKNGRAKNTGAARADDGHRTSASFGVACTRHGDPENLARGAVRGGAAGGQWLLL